MLPIEVCTASCFESVPEPMLNGRATNRQKRSHLSLGNRIKNRGPSMVKSVLAFLIITVVVSGYFVSFQNEHSSNSNLEPIAAFPTRAEFLVARNASYLEGHFFYANTTYSYRYSPKLLTKKYPTRGDPQATPLPKLVFGVCANPGKPVRRNAIRKSWALDAPTFFIVAGNWDEVSKEFHKMGDLLWIDSPEDYRNGLTPKSLGFLHFGAKQLAQRHNMHFDYIFKTDDDVYANVTQMSLEISLKGNPAYYGLMKNATAPIRSKTILGESRKWYMSREDFPDDYFPAYAPGVGYALSRDFANCAANNIPDLIRMPWEDVATGMLAAKCHATLASANDNWSHFVAQGALGEFPYETFKDGIHLVKILHKVQPWYFAPLYKREPLAQAKQYFLQKKKDLRERRREWAEAQQKG